MKFVKANLIDRLHSDHTVDNGNYYLDRTDNYTLGTEAPADGMLVVGKHCNRHSRSGSSDLCSRQNHNNCSRHSRLSLSALFSHRQSNICTHPNHRESFDLQTLRDLKE